MTLVSSSDKLFLSVPKSWEELTQDQLRYVLRLMALGISIEKIELYAFMRFAELTVIRRSASGTLIVQHGTHRFTVTQEDLLLAAGTMAYLEEPPKVPLRLEQWKGAHAVDAALHGVRFGTYLQAENYFQAFLTERDNKYLEALGHMLYPELRETALKEDTELFHANMLLWYSGFKRLLCEQFTDLFHSSNTTGETLDMREIMFSQIRILTGGDVTKEFRVLNVDTWTALGELNEKVKESRRLEKLYKH